ncbi:hypothetical protein [Roseimaritima sediminicola]|uniref:hypothetical protein n=1 Tax=Roseimaritima sediminicola TaxID=2662066 RepID=UPI0012983740|nr:hypothetical protein [Roseimaritima sediminicola]
MNDSLERKAVRLLAGGNPQGAREIFLSAAEMTPDRYSYYLCWAAHASLKAGRREVAIAEFQQAIQNDQTIFSLLSYAQHLIDAGKYAAAKDQLDIARGTNRHLLDTTPGEQYESRLFREVETHLSEATGRAQ